MDNHLASHFCENVGRKQVIVLAAIYIWDMRTSLSKTKLTGLLSLLNLFLYSLQSQHNKTQNKVNFLKLYASKRACPTAV